MEKTELSEHPLDALQKKETVTLLLKGESACREAISSLDSVIPQITDESLRAFASSYRALYEGASERLTHLLEKEGRLDEKKQSSKKSAWLSAQVKLAFRSHTKELSSLLFDGCHVMLRDLYTHLHGAPHADLESRRALRRLIGVSEDFREVLKDFL